MILGDSQVHWNKLQTTDSLKWVRLQHSWQIVNKSVANDWPEFSRFVKDDCRLNHLNNCFDSKLQAVHKSDWMTLSDWLITGFLNTKMVQNTQLFIYFLMFIECQNKSDTIVLICS